jgi:hypothetical protein
MKNQSRVLLLFIFVATLVLPSCKPSSQPTPTPSVTAVPIQPLSTPSPTPTIFVSFSTQESVLPPSGGVLEIRIPYQVDSSTVVADPGVGNECLVEIPFEIINEGERKMTHAAQQIDCHFVIEPGPLPYKVHLFIQGEGTFDGELLPPTSNYPDGWLDSFLRFDGSVTQYYVELQHDIPNLCPETKPCVAPGNNTFTLPFHWQEGSTIEQGWTFILHLEE